MAKKKAVPEEITIATPNGLDEKDYGIFDEFENYDNHSQTKQKNNKADITLQKKPFSEINENNKANKKEKKQMAFNKKDSDKGISNDEYARLNNRLIPYNVVIAVIALVVTILLFFGSFWKVKLTVPLEAEFFEQTFSSAIGDSGSGDSGSGVGNDVFNNIDFSAIDGEKIELSVSIASKSLLGAMSSNAAKKVLTGVVKDFEGQIKPLLQTAVKVVVKAAATTAINAAVQEMQNTSIGEIPESAQEAIKSIDMDELGDTAATVIGNLLTGQDEEGNAFTADQAKEDLRAMIAATLKGIDADTLAEMGLTETEIDTAIAEANTAIDESIDEIMETFGSEDGTINIEKAIAELAGDALGDGQSISFTEGGGVDALVEFIIDQIPEEAVRTVNTAMIAMSILLYVTIAAWAIVLIFAVIKIFTKNKITITWPARAIGCLAFTFFVIIPGVAMLILKKVLSEAMEEFGTLVSSAKISFTSMTIVSFIGACLLFVLCVMPIIGYSKQRRAVKRANI